MSTVEEIKSRIDIVDFIGKYVTLKHAGRNFSAPCPFHTEKTPSFIVSPDKQRWHCFGACHEGGDVVSFVMKRENFTFGEALEMLAPLAGVELKNDVHDPQWDQKKRLISLHALAQKYYHYLFMKHPIAAEARDYVKSRGVPQNLVEAFSIGYAPQSWDSLSSFLLKHHYSAAEIITSGLGIMGKKTKPYDRFRGRLMFPLQDKQGNVVGFSGRTLTGDGAKYMNSPETPIYHKRDMLFGLHLGKETIQDKHEAIIMEGEFDVITAHRFGYINAVGIKGTALTREQVVLLKRYATTFVFCLDTDAAGIDAARRGIALADEYDVSLYVMKLPEGDPADVLSKDPALFKNAYRSRLSIYEFLIDAAVAQNDSSVYGKKAVLTDVGPLIRGIQNPIVSEFVVKYLAKKIDSTPEAIHSTLRKLKKKKAWTPSPSEIPLAQRREQTLLSLIVQSQNPKGAFDTAMAITTPAHMTSPVIADIFTFLAQTFTVKEEDIPVELREAFTLSFLEAIPESSDRTIKATALGIEKDWLKQAMQKASDTQLDEYVRKLSAVEKALRTVYNTVHDSHTVSKTGTETHS